MFHPIMITSFLLVVFVEVPVIQPLEKGFGGKQRRVIRAHEVVHVLLLFCCCYYSCFLSLRIRLLLWRCIIFDSGGGGAHFGENNNWRTSSSQQQLCFRRRVLLKVRCWFLSNLARGRRSLVPKSVLFSICGIFAISKSKRRRSGIFQKSTIENSLSILFPL